MARPPKVAMPALTYLRTSSSANVGADKDSDKRRRQAIKTIAKHADYELIEEFYDAAVSGADPIDVRPAFKALLERIMTNGVRTVRAVVATESGIGGEPDAPERHLGGPATAGSDPKNLPPHVAEREARASADYHCC